MLGLSFTVGCDDPTVAENIDTFTCAYLPWWMATCDSTEVHAKALNILQHGLVDAQVECHVTVTQPYCSLPMAFHVQASKLVDGACLVEQPSVAGGFGGMRLYDRASAHAADCSFSDGDFSYSIASGHITGTYTGTGLPYTCGTNYGIPYVVSVDLTSEACTGFNLAAFGVSP
jgi:hypothetical protein